VSTIMAKNLNNLELTLHPLEFCAFKLRNLTSVGRGYLEDEKKVPENIWAEIDQTIDAIVALIPPDQRSF
jgi:hypothetical protein